MLSSISASLAATRTLFTHGKGSYFGNVILRHWVIANVITKQLIMR